MTKKSKPAKKTPNLKSDALESKRAEAVKGGFLGQLMRKVGKAVGKSIS